MSINNYTLEIKFDGKKDYFLELPDELLKSLNWKVGDELNFIDNKNGSYTISKKDEYWI